MTRRSVVVLLALCGLAVFLFRSCPTETSPDTGKYVSVSSITAPHVPESNCTAAEITTQKAQDVSVTYFLLYMQSSRVGSTFFQHMLTQSNDVWIGGELLRPEALRKLPEGKSALSHFREECLRSGRPKCGMKATCTQLEAFPEVTKVFEAVISLQRRNRLKKALSRIRAVEQSKECGASWHRKKDAACILQDPRPVNVTELRQVVAVYENLDYESLTFANAALAGKRRMDVYYEDVLSNAEEKARRALAFLDASPASLVSSANPFVKMTDDDLHAVVANMDEVEAAFRATPYEHMLNASIPPSLYIPFVRRDE